MKGVIHQMVTLVLPIALLSACSPSSVPSSLPGDRFNAQSKNFELSAAPDADPNALQPAVTTMGAQQHTNGNMWVIDNGKKRAMTRKQARYHGYFDTECQPIPSNFKPTSIEELNRIPDGEPMGPPDSTLQVNCGIDNTLQPAVTTTGSDQYTSGRMWVIDNGKKRAMTRMQATYHGYFDNSCQPISSNIKPISEGELNSIPDGDPMGPPDSNLKTHCVPDPKLKPELNGQLVRAENDPKVYLIEDGARRFVPDETTLIGIGRRPSDVKVISMSEVVSIMKGNDLPSKSVPNGTIIRRKPGNEIYVIESGSKRLIPDEATAKSLGYDIVNSPIDMHFSEADKIPLGQPYPPYIPKVNIKVVIDSVKCVNTEDLTGADSVYVVYGSLGPYGTSNLSSAGITLPVDMNDGDKRDFNLLIFDGDIPADKYALVAARFYDEDAQSVNARYSEAVSAARDAANKAALASGNPKAIAVVGIISAATAVISGIAKADTNDYLGSLNGVDSIDIPATGAEHEPRNSTLSKSGTYSGWKYEVRWHIERKSK